MWKKEYLSKANLVISALVHFFEIKSFLLSDKDQTKPMRTMMIKVAVVFINLNPRVEDKKKTKYIIGTANGRTIFDVGEIMAFGEITFEDV
jgi:hypothetical protein